MNSKKKKTVKILRLFYFFILCSHSFTFGEEDNIPELSEENDLLKKKVERESAFVKFFKEGKHSILWEGVSGSTVGMFKDLSNDNKNRTDIYNLIITLIPFRYNFKSPIKKNINLYFECLVFGHFSDFDFITFFYSFNFLSLNLGIYYTILHKKNFSWDLHVGIDFSWRWSSFYFISLDSTVREKYKLNTKNFKTKNFKQEYGDTTEFPYKENQNFNDYKSILKAYFKPGNFLDNIKGFDILLDLSIFDFTIKNHFKISLSWCCGIAYIFYFLKIEEINKKVFYGSYKELSALLFLGLKPITISIGYVF